MSSSPFRATVDMTGEQCVALDRLARTKSRSRNTLIREAIDAYLRLQFPPAEAAPDDAVSGGDSPPSTPAAATSGVASAGGDERSRHPWRRGRAVSARRVPGGRAE